MRALRYGSYAVAIGLFLLFQGMHASRTAQRARLGAASRSIVEFLGLRAEREQYLIIRQGGAVRGYSGFRVERLVDRSDAIYRVAVEAFLRVLPVLGARGEIAFDGELDLNERGQVVVLAAQITAAGERFSIDGRKDGDEVALAIRDARGGLGPALRVPAELGFGGLVLPIPPLGRLQVGDERRVPYFDPISRSEAVLTVRATGSTTFRYEGVLVEALVLEIAAPVGRFEVTTASEGEVLSVAGPGGVELRRASQREVRSLFKRKGIDGSDPRSDRTE